MDKIEIWEQRVEEHQESGLSQREWCRNYGISNNSMTYWKNKISHITEGIRITHVKPLVEDFYAWNDEIYPQAMKTREFGKATKYADNQKAKMLRFLTNPRIELTNNRAERSVKPFVMGRKNWLFSNTSRGATASALIFTIIQK